MLKRVYLIRHGETEWNTNGRWQGILPVGLNEAGHEQARRLAMYLKDEPIATVYTSDLSRALETAEILAQALGVEVRSDRRWRELNIGVFQGLTVAQIQQRYPEEYVAFISNPLDYVVTGGESRKEFQSRVMSAFAEAVEESGPRQIAVVTHIGVLRTLFGALFPAQFDRAHTFPNTSISILDQEEGWRIAALAQVPHLAEEDDPRPGSGVYF